MEQVLVREIKKEPGLKSEGIISRWSWSDDFFCLDFFVVTTQVLVEVRSHVVATTVCATVGVYTHSLVARTFFCTRRAHLVCAHFGHTSMRVTHTHGSRTRKGMLRAYVVSLSISPSPFSCFTRLSLLFLHGHFETNLTDALIHTILPNCFPTQKRRSSALCTRTSSSASWPSPSPTHMSTVARRKLNFQQLENVLGTSLPAGIKGFATLRDAKLTERSYDKVVMWTGGSYDHDDVMCALVRLDRPEMRLGTSGQNGKTVPIYFTDPEADAPTPAPGSEIWIQPSMDRPHWNEVLDASQEDVELCEDGETTITRDGAIAIPGVFCISDDGHETTVEENEVPLILVHVRPAFRHPGCWAVREELNAAQKARGFFGPRRGAGGREQGPRMKRSSIEQPKNCVPDVQGAANSDIGLPSVQNGIEDRSRYDRSAGRSEDCSKGFIAVPGPTERRPSLEPPGPSSPLTLVKFSGILVPKRDSSGNSK